MSAARHDPNPFGPGLIAFLRALARHNERAWFEKNRERYEAEVREPALAFIRLMGPHVRKISAHLRADDRRVGGSLMRIHRDVRFSRDKSPYKTNLGIQFRHDAGRDVHAPGLYFHVEPGSCFLGAGMWHPGADALGGVRAAIIAEPADWKRMRDGKAFRSTWRLAGDSLRRPPRGFPADHPAIEDLKRRDHIAICDLDERELAASDLVKRVSERYRRAASYLRWLAQAVELPF